MLPDTAHMLDGIDKEAFAEVLAAVALVDGNVTIEEMSSWESRMGVALLPPSVRVELRETMKRMDPDMSKVTDLHPAALRLAIRDGVLMAAIDGRYHPKELELMSKLAVRAGLDEETMERLYDWVDEGWDWMRRGREMLDLPENPEDWEDVYGRDEWSDVPNEQNEDSDSD